MLRELVRPSRFCDKRVIDDLIEEKQAAESTFCRTYTLDMSYSSLGTFGSAPGEVLSSSLRHVSVSERMMNEPFMGERLIAVAGAWIPVQSSLPSISFDPLILWMISRSQSFILAFPSFDLAIFVTFRSFDLGHYADTDGHRVIIFREEGGSAVGSVESGEFFDVTFPTGVAWLEEGTLAITDSGTHSTSARAPPTEAL